MSTVVTEDAIREPLQLLELSDHEVNSEPPWPYPAPGEQRQALAV